MKPAPPVIKTGLRASKIMLAPPLEVLDCSRGEAPLRQLCARHLHPIHRLLTVEPLGELAQPLLRAHPRLVPQHLARPGDVRVAMADVTDAELPRHLRSDVRATEGRGRPV